MTNQSESMIRERSYDDLLADAEGFADRNDRGGQIALPNRGELIGFYMALDMTPAIREEQKAARRAYYRSQGWE